jgi:hypothetical protein
MACSIKRPNPLNPVHAWKLRKAVMPYLKWRAGQTLVPKRRSALPEMPENLRAHAEFAADALQRSPSEISGTMSKHQLALADRQCRMSELSSRIQDLVIILCTSLYAARQEDELVRTAAHVLCQDLRRKLNGHRPTDRYFRTVTALGAAIAEGNFKSIAGLEPDEILMPYEND